MKFLKAYLSLFILVLSAPSYGSSGAGTFNITKVMTYGSGDVKIFTDSATVNGLESCTATDNSIAISKETLHVNRLLSVALLAKSTGSPVWGWVNGCCVTQNGKQSPCATVLRVD